MAIRLCVQDAGSVHTARMDIRDGDRSVQASVREVRGAFIPRCDHCQRGPVRRCESFLAVIPSYAAKVLGTENLAVLGAMAATSGDHDGAT